MEKNTGYVALLFAVFDSPGTGAIRTLTSVFGPNGGWPVTLNVSALRSPGLIRLIVWRRMSGFGCSGIVTVTTTPTSWQQPEFSTVTSNARSVDARIVVGCDVESVIPCGSARTETSPSPWLPDGVPPVEAPCRRSQIETSERALARSGLERKFESGTATPVIPCDFSASV